MYDNGPILDWQLNTNLIKTQAQAEAALGWIPSFLTALDPRPAWEQINERYAHGGGWNPMLPGKWRLDEKDYLHYPGDPAFQPLAMAWLRDEKILIYMYAFVAIVQRDGSFSVARID